MTFGGAASTTVTKTGAFSGESYQTDVDFIDKIITNYFRPIVSEGLLDFPAYFGSLPNPLEEPLQYNRTIVAQRQFGKCGAILNRMGASTEYQQMFNEYFIDMIY